MIVLVWYVHLLLFRHIQLEIEINESKIRCFHATKGLFQGLKDSVV